MLKCRRLDATGEPCYGHGEVDFVSGVEAVALAITSRLRLLRGEWWENLDEGLPLFEDILGRPWNEQAESEVSEILRERILGTPGVLSVEALSLSYDTRQVKAVCTVGTEYGETQVEVAFP